MTAHRSALRAVRRAHTARDRADREYRHAIVEAREQGATLRQIADAAGTGPPNVLRIIRRAKGHTT